MHFSCFSANKKKDDGGWENTPPPLYSPATIPPMIRPARQGLLADSPVTSHRPVFTINKKLSSGSGGFGKLERKSEQESDVGLDGLGSSLRAKVEEYDDDEYYDDFEVVEKGKRRSDGYGDDGKDVADASRVARVVSIEHSSPPSPESKLLGTRLS